MWRFYWLSKLYPSGVSPDLLTLTTFRRRHRCLCFPRSPLRPRTVACMGTPRTRPSTAGPTTTAPWRSTGPRWCQGTATRRLPRPPHRASSSRGSRSVGPFFWQKNLQMSRNFHTSENKNTDGIQGFRDIRVFFKFRQRISCWLLEVWASFLVLYMLVSRRAEEVHGETLNKKYAVVQGSGTYGSSGDGIWLPDNFELQKKNLRPPPCNFLYHARLQQK